jgi:elongation factor G
MSTRETSRIRNIAFVGQNGAGKTLLAEALARLATGKTAAPGESLSDFEPEEKEAGHSLFPTVLSFDAEGVHVNLIDTPGAADLIGPSIACLEAVETVVAVVHAANGVEPVTRRLMDVAREQRQPRIIVINRIDMPHVDLKGLVDDIRERFGPECIPINLPADNGRRVEDCLLNGSGTSDLGSVADAHRRILDQVVELDDTLMERYLAGGEPDYGALHATFEKALDEGHVVPICFTSARDGVGVRELLTAIAKHFPSPIEGNPRPFVTEKDGKEVPFGYENDAEKPLLANVFRVVTDPYVGKIAMFRVYQGKATAHLDVFIGKGKRTVRLGHLVSVNGKEHKDVGAVIAGDIGAVAKLEELAIGDVLHDDHALDLVHLTPPVYPIPFHGLAIAPKSRNDEQKLARFLHRFAEEDPTFRVQQAAETHELVVQGLGELHLRVVLDRLRHRDVQVDTHPPRIPYRETIRAKAEGHYRHKKQTGGAGQFADVSLRVEPLARGAGIEFVDDVFGGAIPKPFIAAVEKGFHDEVASGVIAGYPVQDVRVIVHDGKTHPVDSKEIAFRTAGRFAFRDAFLKAAPMILEPFVKLEVTVPSAKVGNVSGDLASRRGRVLGTDLQPGGLTVIRAIAPLSEVAKYQSELKGLTGGLGTLMMDFSHYDPVPENVQHSLMQSFRPAPEE